MSTDTKPPPEWRHGRLLPNRQSINPSGRPKWVNEFQQVFRERLAKPSADVLARVMDRALDTSDIDGAIDKVDVAENPSLFARLESEKNERFNQAIRAAGEAMKYILPKPKETPVDEDMSKKENSPMAGITREQLLAIARLPQIPTSKE